MTTPVRDEHLAVHAPTRITAYTSARIPTAMPGAASNRTPDGTETAFTVFDHAGNPIRIDLGDRVDDESDDFDTVEILEIDRGRIVARSAGRQQVYR
ncbi:hypothetical protein [Nocardia farcinica]|uniref:hypothetical protein n=1 Tax=Nocardia farcinica TaxID=37329 RepID=UPI002458B386|nr:hypothetical protein [Nocardia farcinica]